MFDSLARLVSEELQTAYYRVLAHTRTLSPNDEIFRTLEAMGILADQEKQRREQATANTMGVRVVAAIGAAVPVRLLKRDLLFVIEGLLSVMDEAVSKCWRGSMASCRSVTI